MNCNLARVSKRLSHRAQRRGAIEMAVPAGIRVGRLPMLRFNEACFDLHTLTRNRSWAETTFEF